MHAGCSACSRHFIQFICSFSYSIIRERAGLIDKHGFSLRHNCTINLITHHTHHHTLIMLIVHTGQEGKGFGLGTR